MIYYTNVCSPPRNTPPRLDWQACGYSGAPGERGILVSAEAVVRIALRAHLLASTAGAQQAVEELWVPRSHERADLAVLGRTMDGFEIKTDRDTLRRLPRQIAAYGRLFDRCTVVIADKHCEKATELVPAWWGVTAIAVNGCVSFKTLRKPRQNPGPDPDTLVRLLWRDEVIMALRELGAEPDPKAHRTSLWSELLTTTTLSQLRRAVRGALISRDATQARLATRRFRAPLTAAVVHP
jgi:hypothetical protein